MLSTPDRIIWLINLFLVLVILKFGREVVRNRRQKSRSEKTKYISAALAELGDVSAWEAELTGAWQSLLSQAAEGASLIDPVDAVVVLSRAKAQADLVQEAVVRPVVNRLNRFAAFLDEGLAKPSEIFKQHPDVHEVLLRILPLVVPFIWYESIVRGVGRWGYRVLRLNEISVEHRALSPRERVRGPVEVEVDGRKLSSIEGIGTRKRVFLLIRLWIRSPSIDTRSKVRQMAQRERLAARIASRDIATASTSVSRETIEW